MLGLRDLLDRFRPAGAPGAPTAAGVPADRLAGVTVELEPVFAALAGVVGECAEVRAAASVEAARRTEEAAEQARAVVARARARESGERASAAALLRQRAAADAAALAAGTEREVDEVRGRDLAPLVARVVERVRRDLAEVGTP